MIEYPIREVKVTDHEAYLELPGKGHRFDLIIPIKEYNEIGRPIPGDTLEINLRVVNKL